jgi:hypothetical protein
LTKYAEQKSKKVVDGKLHACASFAEPWQNCNNCKQSFQNQLAVDLSNAFVSFAEVTYGQLGNGKWDKMRVMYAHRWKMVASYNMKRVSTDEEIIKMKTTNIINALLDMIKQTRKDLNMSRWVHMPKDSEEYQYYFLMSRDLEASAYVLLGMMEKWGSCEESRVQEAILHFKKARAILNLVGITDMAKQMESKISVCTTIGPVARGGASSSILSVLPELRNEYERKLSTFGINSEDTLGSGLDYARALQLACHCIEAEQLVTKLATNSRRVLGPDHKVTTQLDELLENLKLRQILVLPDEKPFLALRYENDGEICVVQGPICKPRNMEDERIYHIANNLLIPQRRCPVICCGLVDWSPHLNGEFGVVRELGDVTGLKNNDIIGTLCLVHFEKKGVKSNWIKPESLRIAFEFPNGD